MPKASTSVRASGRSSAHSVLTARVTAFARVDEIRPCSWNQARSSSIVASAKRSQTRLSPAFEVLVLARLDGARERLQDLALDVGAGGGDHVVLALVEDVERVLPGVDPTLQPPRDAGDHVLLAPAQQAQLVVAVEQVVLVLAPGHQVVGQALDDLADCASLDDRLVDLADDEADGLDGVQLAELVAELGQEALGDELEEDRCCRPRTS